MSKHIKNNKIGIILLRCLIGVVGMLCLIWFSFPMILHGIKNIGNLTGITLSILLVLYSIFQWWVHGKCRMLWKKKAGRITLSFLMTLAGVIMFLAILLSGLMISEVRNVPDGEGTVVILGCSVYGDHPSLMLQNRIEAAYEYLVEHPGVRCVLSGGRGEGENISEAECMYRYLVAKGIEEHRLFKEDQSTSTRENLKFSKQIIEENHLAPELIIVTNEFHEYRAGKVADKLGFAHSAVSAQTAWWLFPTYYVRELYGILAEYCF